MKPGDFTPGEVVAVLGLLLAGFGLLYYFCVCLYYIAQIHYAAS